MPQELRWPENQTEEASAEAIKFLNFESSLPCYQKRGLSDMAFSILWPDFSETDFDLLDIGIKTSDSVAYEFLKDKRANGGKETIKVNQDPWGNK